MAWLAVDKYGLETMHQFKPEFESVYNLYSGTWSDFHKEIRCNNHEFTQNSAIILHKGTIKIILGKDLTFEDSPIEI